MILENRHVNQLIYTKFNLILFIAFIKFLYWNNTTRSYNPTNIPEFLYFKNQTLKVIVPKDQFNFVSPMTLYFTTPFRKENLSTEFEIKKIIIKDKNYFISFYSNNLNYISYNKLLIEQGLIQSKYIFGKNNLFISSIMPNSFSKEKNIYNIDKYQKVYQYINCKIFQKNLLYSQYKSFKNLFTSDFNYMPETFNYPLDKNLINKKFKDYTFNFSDLWIVKPINRYGGEGIEIFENLKRIKFNKFIISKYILEIDKIKYKKYDLRLYVLISGLKPLRIYFYEEGLVRIASEKFSMDKESIANKYIHLTNTDLNKNNKKFIHPNKSDIENSNMWNLFTYKKYLKKRNIEWDEINQKIKDIIIKTIISIQQNLNEINEKACLCDQSFYNLLGFDFLITNDFVPKLLEVNYSPQMFIHNNLDRIIKTNLFVDTLNIVGISPYSRKTNELLNYKRKKIVYDNDNVNHALYELKRPRGNYELIFPLKENISKYKKYFIKNYEENIKFWNIISS